MSAAAVAYDVLSISDIVKYPIDKSAAVQSIMIRAKSNNPAFVAEVEPWLIQFESLGKAGMNSMQMIEATEAGNASGDVYKRQL